MQYMRIIPCLLMVFLLQACSSSGGVNVPNPFASSSASASDIYYEHFEDIPIPRAMSVNLERTLVSVTPEGTRVGLVTTEGRVELPSLINAMAHNLTQSGWAIRGRVRGVRAMDIYEKNDRIAVLYFYDQVLNSVMEIWSTTRLPDGFVLKTPGQAIQKANQGPALYADPYSQETTQTSSSYADPYSGTSSDSYVAPESSSSTSSDPVPLLN